MLILQSLRISSRSTLFKNPIAVQSASYVIARRNRDIANSTEPTRGDTDIKDTTSNNGMEQITNMLDNVAFSESPQSNAFSSESLTRCPYSSTQPAWYL